jgi:CRP-like cAMP-binding protein
MSQFFHYAKVHEAYFLKHGQKVTFTKGHQIVRPDEPNPWVYFLIEGLVKISFGLDDGTERILGYFIPGMVFAKSGSFYKLHDGGLEYTATSNIITYRISQEEFQQQLRANTDFAMDYINRLSLNQIYQIDRIVYQGEKGISTKCIKWILFMSKYYGEPIAKNQCRIYVPLTQDIAANFLHATRESVSSIMRKLTKKGLITSKNKYLTIMDYEGLKNELADSIKNS